MIKRVIISSQPKYIIINKSSNIYTHYHISTLEITIKDIGMWIIKYKKSGN